MVMTWKTPGYGLDMMGWGFLNGVQKGNVRKSIVYHTDIIIM